MPLGDVLENLLVQAKKDFPLPATTRLPHGLEITAKLNPPRLILSRSLKDTSVFTKTDPRSEREGFTCAVALGWLPWLTWGELKDREYLTVCDDRLRYALRDDAVARAGGDTEKAIFLKYDIDDQQPPPPRLWELCATERMDGMPYKQLCGALGLKLK